MCFNLIHRSEWPMVCGLKWNSHGRHSLLFRSNGGCSCGIWFRPKRIRRVYDEAAKVVDSEMMMYRIVVTQARTAKISTMVWAHQSMAFMIRRAYGTITVIMPAVAERCDASVYRWVDCQLVTHQACWGKIKYSQITPSGFQKQISDDPGKDCTVAIGLRLEPRWGMTSNTMKPYIFDCVHRYLPLSLDTRQWAHRYLIYTQSSCQYDKGQAPTIHWLMGAYEIIPDELPL